MSKKKRSKVKPPVVVRETIRGFEPEKLQAPFLLRCGALIIDYMIVLLVPVLSLILGRSFQYDGSKLLSSELHNTGFLVAILLCITNFIIFPVFSGQSIGKMMTGLRIVNMDGSNPGFGKVVLRNTFGYLMTICSGLLGFLMASFTNYGRTLHDFVSGTMVVYGAPQKVVKSKIKKKKKSLEQDLETPLNEETV